MRVTTDVEATPCAWFLTIAGHDDWVLGRTVGIDFGTLLDEKIINNIVILSDNLSSCRDCQGRTALDMDTTVQSIGLASLEREVFSDFTLQDILDRVWRRLRSRIRVRSRFVVIATSSESHHTSNH